MASNAEREWYSPMSDIRLVAKWLVSPEGVRAARRGAIGFLMYLALVALMFAVISQLPVSTGSSKDEQLTGLGTAIFFGLLILNVAGYAAILACITLKARLIRTDQRLAAQHTAYYRARLEGEFAQKEMLFLAEKARWELEQDEWKAKTQNEIYELILGQVERGVLGPRPKTQDGGAYDSSDRP